LRILTRLKDEFVSNVSHELRTPISNLMLRYYLLRKQPDQLLATLPVLERETTRLARIIDDLLVLSRMDQDRTVFTLTALDLNALVDQFVADRRMLAEERGLQLSATIAPGTLMVLGDVGLLEQALSVLLTNALNYTPAGGRILVATQAAQDENGRRAKFSIRDTGPGINKEEQTMLFTRFFRGEVGRASRSPGTGLGLAIAKEIINRHEGQITVESGETTSGTTFTVCLPSATEVS
jgi:two-component system phosphate regulon sensor histidine kinase PhoR